MVNPFQPPSAPTDGFPESVPCPKCGKTWSSKVTFTWWGGLLGARLFNVVRCNSCHKQYNGRTGGSLVGVIIAYQAVVVVILVALAAAFFALR
jgi:hypothetical protein